MQIQPTNNIASSSAVNLQAQNSTSSTDAANMLPVDQLDISAEAQSISQTGTTEIRADRVADIRAQIATGQYETAEKMDIALSRMLNEYA